MFTVRDHAFGPKSCHPARILPLQSQSNKFLSLSFVQQADECLSTLDLPGHYVFTLLPGNEAGEPGHQFFLAGGNHRHPVIERLAADLQSESHITQLRRVFLQKCLQPDRRIPQLLFASGRQRNNQRCHCPCWPGGLLFRFIALQDHVRIGSPRSKRTDPRAQRLHPAVHFPGLPLFQPLHHIKWRILEINELVQLGRMQTGHKPPMLHLQKHLRYPHHPRRRFHMSDVALDRADGTAVARHIVGREGRRQTRDFYRVPKFGPRAMGLNVSDAACVDPGLF